jgi:hypothetical protein
MKKNPQFKSGSLNLLGDMIAYPILVVGDIINFMFDD